MRIYKEVCSGNDFDFWSGAKETVRYLTENEIEQIFIDLEECSPEGMEETELNDFFWFEDDIIAEWLGWPDFETLMKARSRGFETLDDWEEAEGQEEEEEEEEEE